MPRDYAAEYRARQERARSKEFRSYYQERTEKARLDRLNLHPNFRTPWDRPLQADAPGIVGPSGPSPDFDPSTETPDWDYYWPTGSTNPPRPATLQSRYSARTREMQIIFRDGTPWTYTDISPEFWRHFKRIESPGRLIYALWPPYSWLNQERLDQHPGGWGNVVGRNQG